MNLRNFFSNYSWWGKLLGAIFGYLTAGPAGAFFGVLIGNFFDKGLAEYYSSPHLLYHSEKRKTVQKIFFESTFLVMGHIAKADGHVSVQELQMAQLLMNEMRLTKEQKDSAKQFFNEGKQSHFNLHSVLSDLQRVCRDNRALLKVFIDIQYRAAHVDGLSKNKIEVLDAVFSTLGFAPLNKQHRFYQDFGFNTGQQQRPNSNQSSGQRSSYRQPEPPPINTLAHAYALLNISPQASKQEVKKAYRRLLSLNHPDKLIAQGLPEAMIKIANEKTHSIRMAYELICENKGWQ